MTPTPPPRRSTQSFTVGPASPLFRPSASVPWRTRRSPFSGRRRRDRRLGPRGHLHLDRPLRLHGRRGQVTLVTTGLCVIDADQAGDDTYAAAPQVQQSFTVGTASPAPGDQLHLHGAQRRGGGRGDLHADRHRHLGPPGDVHHRPLGGLGLHDHRRDRHVHRGRHLHRSTPTRPATPPGPRPPRSQQSFAVGVTTTTPPTTLPTLTVTADSKSRPFGVANPALTATISGFVNGQTLETSGVTGSPACTTTATLVSPAGTYPITCDIGTLASGAYALRVRSRGRSRSSAVRRASPSRPPRPSSRRARR